jgi:hypothetical protein
MTRATSVQRLVIGGLYLSTHLKNRPRRSMIAKTRDDEAALAGDIITLVAQCGRYSSSKGFVC